MKLWPKSLFGQLLLTMVVGLFVTQIIGLGLIWSDRSELAARMTGYHAAQRISGIVSLLDTGQPENRPALVDALSVPPVDIRLDLPWQTLTDERRMETDYFIKQLKLFLDKPYVMQASTVVRAWPERRSLRAAMGSEVRNHIQAHYPGIQRSNASMKKRLVSVAVVQIRLSDGQIVTFRHDLRRDSFDLPIRVFALFSLLGVSVAILAGWSVRRLTRPLNILSNAAIALGKNIDCPPLPENGPVEVAAAARAFNTMQREIKNLLNTRSQTLAALSHDLRLPITRVRLRLEKLSDSGLKSKLEDDLADIDCMIENTLAFLRAGKSKEEIVPINVNALIDGIVDDMQAVGAQVSVLGHIDAPVSGQPQALRRCLTNLIDNARRYGDGMIDITLIDEKSSVVVKIEDRGPGVPDSEKDRIFEPYIRLEASRAKHTGGNGLGLAIARATARSHGGDVILADRVGGGLSVILRIARNHIG